MRRVVAAVTLVAVVLASAWGAIVVGSASLGGCPTALLAGTLEADTAVHGLLVRTEDGHAMTVTWPIGYGVGTASNGEPVLTRLFVQVAKPGDHVAIGGGEGQTTDFAGCGVIDVTSPVARV